MQGILLIEKLFAGGISIAISEQPLGVMMMCIEVLISGIKTKEESHFWSLQKLFSW